MPPARVSWRRRLPCELRVTANFGVLNGTEVPREFQQLLLTFATLAAASTGPKSPCFPIEPLINLTLTSGYGLFAGSNDRTQCHGTERLASINYPTPIRLRRSYRFHLEINTSIMHIMSFEF